MGVLWFHSSVLFLLKLKFDVFLMESARRAREKGYFGYPIKVKLVLFSLPDDLPLV